MAGINNRKKHEDAEPAKLIDRVAISLFSGITAFLTGLFAWFAFGVFGFSEWHFWIQPIGVIVGFSLIMACLGFFLVENIVINTLTTLWRWLGYLLGIARY